MNELVVKIATYPRYLVKSTCNPLFYTHAENCLPVVALSFVGLTYTFRNYFTCVIKVV